MKKFLTLAAIALFGLSTTFAQTTTTVKQTPKKTTVTTKTKSTSVKLKADGTPDMRYKENKANKVVVAGPKKKDGTADMRYKANKAAAKKKG
ncbi:MAG: hypothetical protein REI64_17170 [Pedobacter sp.]|uniref:hypothetical protein n=1 Tax=Pedobacter sp. TaxID=1411316 RepID=UPI00280729DA|nr:hypothetical protein [Pedobacter sp.]MDQ8006537.1 hypothetical protein [Pedobacter sp.]